MSRDCGPGKLLGEDPAGQPGLTERRMLGATGFFPAGEMSVRLRRGRLMFRLGGAEAPRNGRSGALPLARDRRQSGWCVSLAPAGTGTKDRAAPIRLAATNVADLPPRSDTTLGTTP